MTTYDKPKNYIYNIREINYIYILKGRPETFQAFGPLSLSSKSFRRSITALVINPFTESPVNRMRSFVPLGSNKWILS